MTDIVCLGELPIDLLPTQSGTDLLSTPQVREGAGKCAIQRGGRARTTQLTLPVFRPCWRSRTMIRGHMLSQVILDPSVPVVSRNARPTVGISLLRTGYRDSLSINRT